MNDRPQRSRTALRALAAAVATAGVWSLSAIDHAPGAVRNWDGEQNGNWGAATGKNWVGDVKPVTGDDVVFYSVATNLTTTLDTNYSLNSVSFNASADSNVSIGLNTITLTSSGTNNTNAALRVDAGAAGQHTISSAITLGANSTWINDSTAGGTLTVSGGIGETGGARTLTKAGTGKVTLSGAGSYTGATLVNAGILNIQNATATGTTAGGISVANNATLQLEGGITVGSEALSISGTGASGQNGALVNVSGTNNYGGLLTLGAAATISSDAGILNLTNTGTITGATFGLTLEGAGNGSISGIIGTTSGTLTKNDAGTWTLGGNSTYTGATTINAGTLKLGVAGSGGNGPLGTTAAGTSVTATGAALDLNGITIANAEALSIIGTGVSTTGALTNSGAAASYSGNLTLAGNSSVGGSGDIDLASVIQATSNTLAKVGADTLTLSANNSGSDFVLSVSTGIVEVGNVNGLGSTTGATSVTNGAALDLAGFAVGGESVTINGVRTAGAAGIGALTSSTGSASVSGVVTLNTAASIGGAGNISLTNAGTGLAGSFQLNKVGTGTLAINTANSSTAAIVVDGGVLQVGNASALGNTVGNTSVSTTGAAVDLNGNTVAENFSLTGVRVAGASGVGALTNSNIGSAATTSGVVTLSAAASIGGAGDITLSNGATGLAGNFQLNKVGAGKLTVSTANSSTAAIVIDGGTLVVTNTASLGTVAGGTTVNSGGTLAFSSGGTLTYSTAEAVGATGTGVGGIGAINNVTGANSFAGAITLGAGGATIQSDAGTLTLTGGVVTASGRDVTFEGAGNTTVSTAAISGAGNLIKNDGGVLLLSGTNSYSGGSTTINGGTLRVSGGNGITDTSAVALANVSGAVLDLNGANETVGSLAGGGTTGGHVTLGAGRLTFGDATNKQYDGEISGSGGITKQGSGTATFTDGDSSYSGTTIINAGTLKLGSAGTAGNGPLGTTAAGTSVTATGAALDINGISLTNAEGLSITGSGVVTTGALTNSGAAASYSGVVSLAAAASIGGVGDITLSNGGTGLAGNFQLNKVGNGTLIVSTANSSTAAIVIDAGVLQVDNASALGTTAAGTTVSTTGAALDVNGNSIAENVSITGVRTAGASGVGALTNSDTGTGATVSGVVTLTAAASIGGAGDITLSNGGNGLVGNFQMNKVGAGTLNVNTANTSTAAIVIDGGVLKLGNAAGLGTTATGTTVNTGAALDLNGLTIGAETLSINGMRTSGATGIGALTNSTGSATYGGVVTLASGASIGGAGNITLSGAGNGLIGNNQLNKVGAGTLTVNTGGTSTAAIVIDGGTYKTGSATALGASAGTTTVNSGASLDLNGQSIANETVNLNGTQTSGATGIGALTNSTGTGTLSGTGTVTLQSASSIGGTSDIVISKSTANGITGNFQLNKVGAGNLTISTGNSSTAAIVIDGGTLTVANTTALGTAAAGTTVNNGATLAFSNTAVANAESVSITGTGVGGLGAIQNSTGTSSLAGAVSLAGTATIGAAATSITFTGGIDTNGNTLTFDGAGNTLVNSTISDAGAVIKNGAGVLTYGGTTNANTYGGDTTVNAGRLDLNKAAGTNAIASGTLFVGDGTGTDEVRLLASNQIANGVDVTVASSGLLNVQSFSDTVGNVSITGGAASNVTATSALLTVGTLGLTAGSAGVSTISMGTGAINLGGTVTVAAASGNNVKIAGTSGTSTVGFGASTRIFDVAAGGGAYDLEINGIVSGAAGSGLTKQGAGILLLNTNTSNSYTGTTLVSNGTLKLSTTLTNNINASPTINIASGAFLNVASLSTGTLQLASGQTLKGTGTVTGNLNVAAGSFLRPGNSIGTETVTGNLTLAGTYDVELGTAGINHASPGLSDRTDVGGSVALGGTLNLIDNAGANGNGSFGPGSYRILTYGTTRTGSFTSIINPLGSLHATVSDGGAGTGSGQGVFVDVYGLASATRTPATLNFANYRVGDSVTTQNISVTNSAPAFSESLDASMSATAGITTIGTISLLAAGATDSTSLQVGINTASAGSKVGTVTVAFNSNGSGTSGAGTTALASQTVSVTGGSVYRLASASAHTPEPINLGVVHVGDITGQLLSLTNTATNADVFSEKLNASFSGTTGDATASGSFALLAAQGTNSTSLNVGVNTSSAGSKSGTATIALASDGTGTSGLSAFGIGTQTVNISATVNEYAQPTLVQQAGDATLSQVNATTYVLNFGGHFVGSGIYTGSFNVLNFFLSSFQDTLGGSFDLTGLADFGASGFASFSGVAPGNDTANNTLTFDTSMGVGSYVNHIYLNPTSSNVSGTSGLSQIDLIVQGNVQVPEPTAAVVIGMALGGLSLRRVRRRKIVV